MTAAGEIKSQLSHFPMDLMLYWYISALGVRREKAAFSCGFQSHPAKAPAGSNRSGHGGNDMAEAFG